MFQLVGFLKIESHIIGCLCGIIEGWSAGFHQQCNSSPGQNPEHNPRPDCVSATELAPPSGDKSGGCGRVQDKEGLFWNL